MKGIGITASLFIILVGCVSNNQPAPTVTPVEVESDSNPRINFKKLNTEKSHEGGVDSGKTIFSKKPL